MNIWVNGCFDIIHTGHIDLLWFAKNLKWDTNKLIVGVDGDERVRAAKGEGRPINNIKSRITMLSSLKMVDEVAVFHSDNELRRLIKDFKIDYIVIGDQYVDKEVIGVENTNKGVVFFPVSEISTTKIIEKIKNK